MFVLFSPFSRSCPIVEYTHNQYNHKIKKKFEIREKIREKVSLVFVLGFSPPRLKELIGWVAGNEDDPKSHFRSFFFLKKIWLYILINVPNLDL